MLTEEQIKKYQGRLEAERVQLMQQISTMSKPENFGSDVDDFSEEQQEAEALASDLAAQQALKERVNEIDAALNKIREGGYGICATCGGEITGEELELIPETRLCVNCKK